MSELLLVFTMMYFIIIFFSSMTSQVLSSPSLKSANRRVSGISVEEKISVRKFSQHTVVLYQADLGYPTNIGWPPSICFFYKSERI
jgi:hypothetical protein